MDEHTCLDLYQTVSNVHTSLVKTSLLDYPLLNETTVFRYICGTKQEERYKFGQVGCQLRSTQI
jgi:hypothetical protein